MLFADRFRLGFECALVSPRVASVLAARVDPEHIGHGAPGVGSREEAARGGLFPTRERPLKRDVQGECVRLEAEHVERKFELVES